MSPPPRWSVCGTYFEACNCVPVCPCRQVGGRPGGRSTTGICEFALSWWVREGTDGDVALDDRRVVMVGRYDDDEPGSPWTVSLFIDDDADDHQHQALVDIFLGRAGGTPSRNYAGAIGHVAVVRPARVDLDHQRRHWRIRVDATADDRVDVRADDPVHAEEAVACGIPGLDHPGEEVRSGLLAVSAGTLQWEWSDRCGFATDFSYVADG